jgi:hypothetical protein
MAYMTRDDVIALLVELGVQTLPQEAAPIVEPPEAPTEPQFPWDVCPSLTALFDAVMTALPDAVLRDLETRTAEHLHYFEASFGSPVSAGDRLRACAMALGDLASHPLVAGQLGADRPGSMGMGGAVALNAVTERLGGLGYIIAGYHGNYRTYSRPVVGGTTGGVYDHLPAWLRNIRNDPEP